MTYLVATLAGNLAYWLSGGHRRLLWNHQRACLDWPDPDDAPLFLAFLLTPLPGLVAILDFVMIVYHKTGCVSHKLCCVSRMRH